jgi:hypothetical protein
MRYVVEGNFEGHKYKGKSLLIIGGGPSTDEVAWDRLDVDFKWSCNGFYLHPLLRQQDLDLVVMGNLQDYRDENLINYLRTHNTKVLFERPYLYTKTVLENAEFHGEFANRVYYSDCDKAYSSIVGPPARLMMLACTLGVSDIYYVGIDGFDPNLKNKHAFTKEDGLRSGASHNQYSKYYDAHTKFFRRIYEDFGSSIKFHNLGELATSHNIASVLTKKMHPLDESVIEQIR